MPFGPLPSRLVELKRLASRRARQDPAGERRVAPASAELPERTFRCARDQRTGASCSTGPSRTGALRFNEYDGRVSDPCYLRSMSKALSTSTRSTLPSWRTTAWTCRKSWRCRNLGPAKVSEGQQVRTMHSHQQRCSELTLTLFQGAWRHLRRRRPRSTTSRGAKPWIICSKYVSLACRSDQQKC